MTRRHDSAFLSASMTLTLVATLVVATGEPATAYPDPPDEQLDDTWDVAEAEARLQAEAEERFADWPAEDVDAKGPSPGRVDRPALLRASRDLGAAAPVIAPRQS